MLRWTWTMRATPVVAGTLLAVAGLAFAAPALAQRRGGGPDLSGPLAQLASTDQDEVRAGLEALGLSGSPRAVTPIVQRVERGLPPELLGVAVDTLMILGRPEAGPLLFDLMHHRRADIRLKAIQAILATLPPGHEGVLVTALGDSEPTVRAAAAEGLGSTGAVRSIDALFHALERGVPEAAMAIAALARPSDVDRMLALVGTMPFEALTPALSELLHRRDLADRSKVAIIHRLTELATPGVRSFLEDFVASLPPEDHSEVRRAAEEAIPRIAQ
ncbi:MAG: HEAT repeat domain-containing protein [Sandaracinaceae bacterium]